MVAADNAAAAVGPKVALITDVHQRRRAHIRVTNRAFSVALFAQTTNRDSWRLSAEKQVGVVSALVSRYVLGHGGGAPNVAIEDIAT